MQRRDKIRYDALQSIFRDITLFEYFVLNNKLIYTFRMPTFETKDTITKPEDGILFQRQTSRLEVAIYTVNNLQKFVYKVNKTRKQFHVSVSILNK